MRVFAPELFGNATMTTASFLHFEAGLIYNPDVAFISWGTQEEGWIKQIAGEAIDNYGNTDPIPFRKEQKFQGWVGFREHARKFCGGLVTLPAACMLK